LTERVFELETISPVDFYGVNDSKLNIYQKFFPKVKVIGRGSTIKIMGEEKLINEFYTILEKLANYYHRFGKLNESDIEQMLGGISITEDSSTQAPQNNINDVLLFGNNGLIIKARSPNQVRMVESIVKSDMMFAIGPAGTGKTYTAVALAVRALKNKEVKRLILTRPAVEAGENLGFLPGDLKEKLDPYLQPLYDALRDMLPSEKLAQHIENGVIQIAPLAFMRGRTLDNAFVILDEAQNATQSQMKMFLTRMGRSAKFIITGDTTQVDLPKNQPSGLIQAIKLLNNVKGIDFIHLDTSDVIRHKLVKDIIIAYNNEPKS
jgi:phosphate starvation-inducible protein PhoH and related proteins